MSSVLELRSWRGYRAVARAAHERLYSVELQRVGGQSRAIVGEAAAVVRAHKNQHTVVDLHAALA